MYLHKLQYVILIDFPDIAYFLLKENIYYKLMCDSICILIMFYMTNKKSLCQIYKMTFSYICQSLIL